jgi:hypothetical protein
LEVGEHEMQIRRVGYFEVRAPVTIKPGCRIEVESYISVQAVGSLEVGAPRPMPWRIVITTCR